MSVTWSVENSPTVTMTFGAVYDLDESDPDYDKEFQEDVWPDLNMSASRAMHLAKMMDVKPDQPDYFTACIEGDQHMMMIEGRLKHRLFYGQTDSPMGDLTYYMARMLALIAVARATGNKITCF